MKEKKNMNNYNDLNETLKDIFTPQEFDNLSEEAKEIFLNAKEVEDKAVDWPFNYTIDGVQFAIYSNNEADQILTEDADNLFDDLIYEVPNYWREYIDRDKWLENNTENDFVKWFENYYYIEDLSTWHSFYYIFKES